MEATSQWSVPLPVGFFERASTHIILTNVSFFGGGLEPGTSSRTMCCCHRRESKLKPSDELKRRRKQAQFRAGSCLSRIEATEDTSGRIAVRLFFYHTHRLSPETAKLPQSVRLSVRQLLDLKLSTSEVVCKIRERYPRTHRGFFLTEKDVCNIRATHDVTRMHADDVVSVAIAAKVRCSRLVLVSLSLSPCPCLFFWSGAGRSAWTTGACTSTGR